MKAGERDLTEEEMQQALFREMRRIGRIGMGMVQMEGELTKMGLILSLIHIYRPQS